MKDPVKRAQRIANVIEQMQRMEEFKLIEARRRLDDARTREVDLIDAISSGEMGDPRVLKGFSKRLVGVSGEILEAEKAVKAQSVRRSEVKRQAAQADANLDAARRDGERKGEERQLAETIDRVTSRVAASAPQGGGPKVES